MSGLEQIPATTYPRHPEWRHYEEYHRRQMDTWFGLTGKASVIMGKDGLALGVGGDIVLPALGTKGFDLGLGFLYYPSKDLGKTGFRFSVFGDFASVVKWGNLRLGLYTDIPMPGEIKDNYSRIEAGIYSEVLATFFKWGPLKFGGSFMAGMGASAGGLNFFIAPGVKVEFKF